ncbi:MAG: type IV pilus twitching motility protein PilT [Gemmatimonadaceae bacterium]|nr:type IV pilus twitching motility protein PilT [Gemmatimonadaceae bacterium]
MAQLDRLLSVMVTNRADAILLMENDVAKMLVQGDTRPLTKSPLSAGQIVALLREIAPPDAAAHLAAGTATTFRYDNPDGSFGVKLRAENGSWQCSIAVDDHGAFQRLTGAFRAVRDAAEEPAMPTPVPVAPSPELRVGPRRTGEPFAEARGMIDDLLRTLVTKGGSDLHLRVGEPPIIRLHGEMVRLEGKLPMEHGALEAMLLSIMPQRNQDEFLERNDTDYAYEIEGVARFRANAMRERKGVGAVFRVIPATVVSVEQLGIPQEVQNLCYLTKGLVLVTGPTGSGKSTTLCSLVDLVNRIRTDHVITIEDPIEFVHQNKNCIITQRQVGVHTDSFKSALRAALREDPDVILVGELRDLETTSIAIETAETGHLVFGTLHTTTAASTIDRIIDQFPADRQDQIRTMLSESLKGVISQTLCKKIGGGRVAVREIMLHTPALANLIREGKTFQIPSMIQTSKKFGMITLNDALLELVEKRQVEVKEAYTKAVDKQGFVGQLKSAGHDVSFLDGEDEAPKKGPARPAAARR